jgi:hypothetical protein
MNRQPVNEPDLLGVVSTARGGRLISRFTWMPLAAAAPFDGQEALKGGFQSPANE